jgi:SHS2 domain-containing protein
MVRQPYEVFEHTADIGLHAYGQALPELFVNAAAGMESLMVAPEQVAAKVSREVSVDGHDLVSLLVSWLNELIFLFDTEYLLLRQFKITDFTGTYLKATVTGEPYDSTRHALSSAIKAVTWHEAYVQPADNEAGGYKARIIFDI